jgi:acetyl esterase/lipase
MRGMRNVMLAAALLAATSALAQQPLDPTMPIVVKVSGKIDVKSGSYQPGRTWDLYRPANDTQTLPLVIFVNGVGLPALKDWAAYTSWGRLIAANGMAAITYQTEGEQAREQTEALLAYVKAHAAELKIDPRRIALWACSANSRVATAMLAEHGEHEFRAAALYYGILTTAPKHDELPLLITRAGLDSLALNQSIDRYVEAALTLDAPVTLHTYRQGRHGFDFLDDTAESKLIIRNTVDFLKLHLTATPAATQMTPAQLERMVREKGAAATLEELRNQPANAFVLQESTLNTLGYALLTTKRVADAVAILEFTAGKYLTSANAHDSLADAYEAAGETAKAIASAERALALLDQAPPRLRDGIRRSAEEKLGRLKR